jgi:DNA-binding transcriptional LysR family regulator
MTLDQLRTFQAVAAVRSFRGAADVLHITQPAISKQIQALEAELNERLFERGKRAQLTSAGTALLKHAEHLSRILTVAKEEITDLRELRAGRLSVGAAHSMAVIAFHRYRHPTAFCLLMFLDAQEKLLETLRSVIDFEFLDHLAAL